MLLRIMFGDISLGAANLGMNNALVEIKGGSERLSFSLHLACIFYTATVP